MSEAAATTTAPAAATEPTVVAPETTAAPVTEAAPAAATEEAGVAAITPEDKPADADATPAGETKAVEEKVVEPITSGQLNYKGPGFVKSIIPSRKEFWLSDEAVAPQHLDLYLRGEKPEISNPVVAWASQTGKGLLFFNKKGDTKREHPQSVLPLYDAVDLKKAAPHEIAFKLHNHLHILKASSDEERDGWYLSIEKAVELGKSQKETIRESEGYKAEIEKLNKPNIGAVVAGAAGAGAAGAAGVAGLRSKSKSKKEDETKPVGSDGEAEKDKKSRSTSRGVLGRFQRKKEEAPAKEAETSEVAAVEEAKKEETAEAPLDAQATAERVVAAPVEGEAATETPAVDAGAVKTEEKPKPSKRGSIFGKVAGFGGIRSPTKEKDAKEAELKPEAATTEVSETAPQIPEPSTQTASEAVEAEKAEKAVEAGETPKEKSNFLSAFIRRSRSVSPSQKLDEASLKELESPEQQAGAATATTEAEAALVAAATTEAAPVATEADKPVEEAAKETPTANKRQSMLGNLGRRASKALKGIQAPKKENTAPAAVAAEKEEEKAVEAAPVAATTETPVVNGESQATEAEKTQIGDVVPEAITVGQPQQGPATVAAGA